MRLSDLFIALNLALIIHAPIVLLFSPGSGGNRGDLVEIYEVTIEAPSGATRDTQSSLPSPPLQIASALKRDAQPLPQRPVPPREARNDSSSPSNSQIAAAQNTGTQSAGPGDGGNSATFNGLFRPEYPAEARRRGLEGRVVLKAAVGADGAVSAVELVTSSGHEILDSPAIKALQSAKFLPATIAGLPVASQKTIAFRFRLDDAVSTP